MDKSEFYNWVLGVLLIIVLWNISSLFISESILPKPIVVLKSIYNNWELHFNNVVQTMLEALGGLIISSAVAIMITLIIGCIPHTEKMLYPFVVLIKSTPAIAFVPILVSFLGTGTFTKVTVAAFICLFPLVIGSLDGMKRTPERLLALAESYGGSSIRSFIFIRLGYCIDGFCSGLKTAAPLSIIGAIVGEYVVGGNSWGLGSFIISNAVKSVKINLYAGAVLSTVIGLIFFAGASFIHHSYAKRLHIRK